MSQNIYLSITYNSQYGEIYKIYCTCENELKYLLSQNKTILFDHICYDIKSYDILCTKNVLDIKNESLKLKGLLFSCKNNKELDIYKKFFYKLIV